MATVGRCKRKLFPVRRLRELNGKAHLAADENNFLLGANHHTVIRRVASR